MAEIFPTARVVEFLPIRESPVKQLNGVRESIRQHVKSKRIAPCEPFLTGEMVLCEPIDVVRILPEFRKILSHVNKHGISLGGISSRGKYVLHNSVDKDKYYEI